MTKIFNFALLGVLAPALAGAVDELQYSYVEVGYETGEIDVAGVDIDIDGFGGVGSVAVSENIAITASAAKAEIETAPYIGRDTDSKVLSIGVTPHFPLAENIDLVVPISVQRVDLRAGSFIDDDETGYSIGVGVRALISPQIELAGGVAHVDVEDDDQGVNGSVRFHATENFSAALGASIFSDSQSIIVSGRFAF